MKFYEVAHCFNDLEQLSSRLEMTQRLAGLLRKASTDEAEIIINLALGMLRPVYEGTVFNIAQKSLIVILATLSTTNSSAIEELVHQKGDIGLVVESLMPLQPIAAISLQEVYDSLCAIEAISGTGSHEQKSILIIELLKKLDALCAKLVIKIISGTLRLGFSDMTLVDALSWMITSDKSLRVVIEQAYNKCSNLGLVAKILKVSGIQGIEQLVIQPGMPIRLAAAERMDDAQAIVDKLGACSIEPKLDGLRLQAHVDNSNGQCSIKLFSRNLLDMTPMFPEIVTALTMLNVQKVIIDGEAIGYNTQTNCFLSFQETSKRRRKHDIAQSAQEFPMRLYAFDILYLDDHDILNKPYSQRRLVLKQLLDTTPQDTIHLIEQQEVTSAEHLEDYFLTMNAKGMEGIMVKKNDAIYQAGKRNFNWVKLKRLENSTLNDTIDVVVIGYYPGGGKRAAFGMGAFLAAIYNKQTDSFQTVAKVGSGLSDVEWHELYARCTELKVLDKPSNVECAPELYPLAWVQPKIVCVVRADEITLSPLHTAGKTATHDGLALRFPRFIAYASDKSPEQATEVQEMYALYDQQKNKKLT